MINGSGRAEIALALILLTGAGLLLRALIFLHRAPTGLVAEHVLTLRLESLGLCPAAAPAETESGRSARRAATSVPSRSASARSPGCAPRGS